MSDSSRDFALSGFVSGSSSTCAIASIGTAEPQLHTANNTDKVTTSKALRMLIVPWESDMAK